MRRAVLVTTGLYLVATLATHLVEAAGVRRCGCSADCWCRRPGLVGLRWVLPAGHR